MSLTKTFSVKKFGANLAMLALIVISMAFVANAFQTESPKPAEPTSKSPDHIEVTAKILSIDPIKGDVSARLEFFPMGKYAKEDGSLTRNIKFDTYSSNGKQEITFEKGKRMSPSEVILNMYDGEVSNYPFDKHKANLVVFFTVKPDKVEKPKPAAENPDDEKKPAPAAAVEEDEEDYPPFTLDFKPSLAGYNIDTAKSKESDDTYVDVELTIARSGMVKFFSVFVMLLMWGVTLAVLGLVFTVVILGRKVEIAMFSFIATLIFAFVAVRNSQPSIPPIGISFDYLSFFLAEVVLALCLLMILATWIFRPAK
jgi:hypothetical protein